MVGKELIRLDKLLSNLGYCSRSEVRGLIREGALLVNGEPPRAPDLKVDPQQVTVDGEPLDPLPPLTLIMNKPSGYVCSKRENSPLVYELLPDRFQVRNPELVTVGRLDKETTGLLIITDDGALAHRITSPKHHVKKIYEAALSSPISDDAVAAFASGELMLDGESEPCLPAELQIRDPLHCTVTVTEGRYHQVRRMFAAVGSEVLSLHRSRVGELDLDGVPEGEFRIATAAELAQFA